MTSHERHGVSIQRLFDCCCFFQQPTTRKASPGKHQKLELLALNEEDSPKKAGNRSSEGLPKGQILPQRFTAPYQLSNSLCKWGSILTPPHNALTFPPRLMQMMKFPLQLSNASLPASELLSNSFCQSIGKLYHLHGEIASRYAKFTPNRAQLRTDLRVEKFWIFFTHEQSLNFYRQIAG